MGHVNLPPSKRTPTITNIINNYSPRHWRLIDLISAAFFGLVFLFFVFVFTSLGDSLAASGRQTLLMSGSDPQQRLRLVAAIEVGQRVIDACPADAVDHMPCENPRLNSQLSREMNYYRERHCPPVENTVLCLVPPPSGYKVSVQWPESLHKV